MMCRFHVQTAGSSLTAQSIDNNVVRTTIQALAAVLGGAQSLHTNSRDEALALPTEEAARLALRTQQILAYESGRDRDARPAGRLLLRREPDRTSSRRRPGRTSTRSRRWAGRSPPSRRGFQQRQIQEAAYRVQRAIEPGDQIVVGVNRSATTRSPRRRSSGSIPRASAARSSASGASAPSARPTAWAAAHGRLEAAARGDGQPHAADHRGGQGRTPRWARSATGCGSRGASTAS